MKAVNCAGGLLLCSILSGLVAPAAVEAQSGQSTSPAAPAPAAGAIDKVIELTRSGLDGDFIVRAIARESLHADLSSDDLLRLKRAGVADAAIRAMMSAPAAAPATVGTALASASIAAVTPAIDARDQMRRAIIDDFDWATVRTSVNQIFGTHVDIGSGLRAVLTNRIQEGGKIRIVERAKKESLFDEQNIGVSTRVRQGTNARIGRMLGADVYLMGNIVAFGRDDRDTRVQGSDIGIGGPLGRLRIGSKEEKAVVAIAYRLVDAETGEVIDSGEARGESSRKSKGFGGLFGWSRGAVAGGVDMTSRNFQETIIGEAVIAAADNLANVINSKAGSLPRRELDIEARVADVSGAALTIAAGSDQGVAVGQRYDVFRIVAEIKDPLTGEILDNKVERLGAMVIVSVRERIAEGQYTGAAVPIKSALVRTIR